MSESKDYCFLAFGELAVDITYDESRIIKEAGGVSAFNTLYYLSVLGKEAYAIGGVGNDQKSGVAINSLQHYCVDTDYIEPINKPTNVFYIYKPKGDVKGDNDIEIARVSPFTGKSSIEWTNKLHTNLPEKFKERNIVLIISNFEPVTRQFVKNVKRQCKNAIVSLDITNGKIFEQYSATEILEYLKLMNLLQCNENTASILCNKLNVSSPNDLFSLMNAEIFTLTSGSRGATFFYRDNGEEKSINKKPKVVAPLIDPTGAGDAFHAMLLIAYCKMKANNTKLDETYFDRAFDIANTLSRKVVQSEGARLEPYDVLFYLIETLGKEKIFELEIER